VSAVVSFEKLKKFVNFNKEGSIIESSVNIGKELVVFLTLRSLNEAFDRILDLNFLCLLDKLKISSCFLK
jgi:hypothetical protein